MGYCIESKLSENFNSIPIHTLKKNYHPSPHQGGGEGEIVTVKEPFSKLVIHNIGF